MLTDPAVGRLVAYGVLDLYDCRLPGLLPVVYIPREYGSRRPPDTDGWIFARIGADVNTALPIAGDFVGEPFSFAPKSLAVGSNMRELETCAGFPCRFYGEVHGRFDPAAGVAAHMGRVHAAVAADDSGQRLDLLWRGMAAGLIRQSGGKTAHTELHELMQVLLHGAELAVGTRALLIAHEGDAQAVVTDHLIRVDADTLLFQNGKILFVILPEIFLCIELNGGRGRRGKRRVADGVR